MPLLDRVTEPPRFSCSIDRVATPISNDLEANPAFPPVATASFGDAVFAVFTLSNDANNPDPLYWAQVQEDGTLGAATEVFDSLGAPRAAVADAQGLAVAWVSYQNNDISEVFVSFVDPSASSDADMPSPILIGYDQARDIVPLDRGYGVLLEDLEGASFVQVVVGDDNTLSATELFAWQGAHRAQLIRSEDGFAIAATVDGDCQLALWDAAGNPGVKTTIRQDDYDNPPYASCYASDLLATDDGFLATVHLTSELCETHINPEYGDEQASRSLHVEIVRVSKDGALVGQAVPIVGPVASIKETTARLVEMGENIGVVWSSGSVVYVCGGCISDETLNFAMLSKTDLVPVSGVLTTESNVAGSGLTPGPIIPHGDSFMQIFNYDFHAWSTSGSLKFGCSVSGPIGD